ncbi:MAG TPA: lipid kinase, partial [Clostridiales bacterium]|nr:lipid kinase [Clostridiales bacterium]
MPSVFYACGGDGTLHEVVNAACGFNHVSVGVIPCGSGNDFIKNFDNADNFHSIESQINGKSVNLDLIKVMNEFAVSVCNIGFDADAAFNMHKFKKVPFVSGSGRYFLSVFYCLMKKLGKNLEIIID